jgi:hypothetical protein
MGGLKQRQANLTLHETGLQVSCGFCLKEREEDMWVLHIGLSHVVHELATQREGGHLCVGGYIVLSTAQEGVDLRGVVSFHDALPDERVEPKSRFSDS